MNVESDPKTITAFVRRERAQGKRVGVVPTMGALHEGHMSLVHAARDECDSVIVTIFVNPTQFGPGEDFDQYPRTMDTDVAMCRAAAADVVFAPTTETMYPDGAQTVVATRGISEMLEGASRPGHFDGVTTIVAKLFNITEPDRAYFGQKDYQQQLVIRQMVRDLNFPLHVVTCPIVREADGLAMSSRNRYLSESDRATATTISQSLTLAAQISSRPDSHPDNVESAIRHKLSDASGIHVEYAVVVEKDTLQPLTGRPEVAVGLIAAKVGTTRLIDNAILQFR